MSDAECPNAQITKGKSKTRSEASLSPQRNQSFIAAVVNAIKNATSSAKQTNKRTVAIEGKF